MNSRVKAKEAAEGIPDPKIKETVNGNTPDSEPCETVTVNSTNQTNRVLKLWTCKKNNFNVFELEPLK